MPDVVTTAALRDDIVGHLLRAFEHAKSTAAPFEHWQLHDVLPAQSGASLRALPFLVADLGGVSGKRELHNDQRCYFAGSVNDAYPLCAALADAFQSDVVVRAVEAATATSLAGTYVRLEYAQDVDGFWLQPHTDLGVKRFTMLIYLPDSPEQHDLGTDIYADEETWTKRYPFIENSALAFIPGDNTWHGMERRPIHGVRRSLIMNYVTDAWRERGQLAYPDRPVLA